MERANLWWQVRFVVSSYALLLDLFPWPSPSLFHSPTPFPTCSPNQGLFLHCVWNEASKLIHVRVLMAEHSSCTISSRNTNLI